MKHDFKKGFAPQRRCPEEPKQGEGLSAYGWSARGFLVDDIGTMLLQGHTTQQLLHVFVGITVQIRRREEVHMQALHVLHGIKLARRGCRFAAQSHFKRAQTVDSHAFGVLQMCGHHFYQLNQNGRHVASFERTVALNLGRDGS